MATKTGNVAGPKFRNELKSLPVDSSDPDSVGRSYYIWCLESALDSIRHARALMAGDVTDENHELPTIETLLVEALDVS